MRLARFNVNTGVVDKRYFQGLLRRRLRRWWLGFIWLMTDRGRVNSWLSWSRITWIMFAFTLYAGLTMVTNVPFYSFKRRAG